MVLGVHEGVPGCAELCDRRLSTFRGTRAQLHDKGLAGQLWRIEPLDLRTGRHGVSVRFGATQLGLVREAVVRCRPLQLVGPAQVQLGKVHQGSRAILLKP
ncbi:hypothetical protein BH18ACT9_BH18ACT9_14230 [soil metagenome]